MQDLTLTMVAYHLQEKLLKFYTLVVPFCLTRTIGVTWGGYHSSTKASATGRYNMSALNMTLYSSGSSPNSGRVWDFAEEAELYDATLYAENIDISVELQKQVLESANTTEAVLQYTHTYTTTEGSISIDTGGAGFSLNGVSDQWSIVCTLNNIPY